MESSQKENKDGYATTVHLLQNAGKTKNEDLNTLETTLSDLVLEPGVDYLLLVSVGNKEHKPSASDMERIETSLRNALRYSLPFVHPVIFPYFIEMRVVKLLKNNTRSVNE